MNNYTYTILEIDDLPKVDFSEIHETSQETLRRSISGDKFIIEYQDTPDFLANITPVSILNHAEVRSLINTEEWTTPK